jgi:hypothetical protein
MGAVAARVGLPGGPLRLGDVGGGRAGNHGREGPGSAGSSGLGVAGLGRVGWRAVACDSSGLVGRV